MDTQKKGIWSPIMPQKKDLIFLYADPIRVYVFTMDILSNHVF